MTDEQVVKALSKSIYITEIYREVYEVFYRLADSKNLRVLEIGAGGTQFSSKYFNNVIISNFNEKTGNAENLEFGNESFDLIIAKDVLHHIKDIKKAFKEFKRVLSKNGKVLASEPSWSILGKFIYKFLHPEPWYKSKEFKLVSNNPWDSNQRFLRNLLDLNDLERTNLIEGFTLTIHPGTYGVSYLLSGGVRKNRLLPENWLIYMHKNRKKIPNFILRNFQLNTFAEFKRLD